MEHPDKVRPEIARPPFHGEYPLIRAAVTLVFEYILGRLEKTDTHVTFGYEDVYVVWFSKTLQNWKALLSTTLPDGMYYEVTYDGDKQKAYIDAYKKFDNVAVSLGEDLKALSRSVMTARVTLLARKFADGDKTYRASLRPSIDAHPQRDRIVELIEAQDINYKTGNRRRKRTTD